MNLVKAFEEHGRKAAAHHATLQLAMAADKDRLQKEIAGLKLKRWEVMAIGEAYAKGFNAAKGQQ